ncbi:MAG TPA: hypothetical protein VGT99_13570, partial [Gammaproteobacteria bacterium]|nr:hypothetical protein [Gammaproteobacteria bacterium]
ISGPANDWTPAFAPDGKTLYFTRSGVSWGFILESHQTGSGWSEPVIAPFSGEYPDSSPAMAPDGTYLVFQSQRPATAALAAEQRRKHTPLKVSTLWRVARRGAGWDAAERLPDTVNISGNMWKPSVAADGDLYFISKADSEKNLHLYRSRYQGGRYLQAEPLPFSDGSMLDVDPAVAADSSYLIFSSKGRVPFKDEREHLFIVFREGDAWGKVTPMCDAGPGNGTQTLDDDAVVGPDQRTLYFSSDRNLPMHLPHDRAEAERAVKGMQGWNNGNANVWSMSLAPWLDAAKSKQAMPVCS